MDNLKLRTSPKPEQPLRNVPLLNLLAPLRDSVPTVMPIQMLELLVARVARPAVNLDRPVGRFACEAVRAEVAH